MKLKYLQFINSTMEECIALIKTCNKWEELKYNQDLICAIAKYINKMVDEKDVNENKIDRTSILLTAFQQAFNLSDDDMETLKQGVDYLIDHKIINKFKLSKKTRKVFGRLKRFFGKICKVIA